MNVGDERLCPIEHHLDGPAGAERRHAQVDVHADVFPRTKGATHPDGMAANLFRF
jgi:hypothetical protein